MSSSSNSAMNATRASSFAAALRKLAKQAVDPAGMYYIDKSRNSEKLIKKKKKF